MQRSHLISLSLLLTLCWACGDAEPGAVGSDCAKGCAPGLVCAPGYGCQPEDFTPTPDDDLRAQWQEIDGLGSETYNAQKLPHGDTTPKMSFCGVQAYSNKGNEETGSYGSTIFGYKWHCTEYAYRFLCTVYNPADCRTLGKMGAYGDAGQWFGNMTHPVLKLLERHVNGSTVRPQPGDILAAGGGKHGHVAIVRAVGEDYVTIIEQNYSSSERDAARTLRMNVSADGRYTIPGWQGWMRLPGASPACASPRPTLILPEPGTVHEARQPLVFTWTPGVANAPHTLRIRNLDTDQVVEHQVGAATSWTLSDLPVGSFRWTVFYRDASCAQPDDEGRCSADARSFQLRAGAPSCDVNACRLRSRTSGAICDRDQLVSCGAQNGCEVELGRQGCASPQRCSESGMNASCTTTCTPNVRRQCTNGAIYEYDSCGQRGALVRRCAADETCPDGDVPSDRCVAACTPNASMRCDGNAVRYFDSCGNRGAIAQTCASNQTCSGDRCVSACTPNASMRCDGNAVRYYDSCNNPGGIAQTCASNQTCSGDRCVTQAPRPGFSVSPQVGSTTQRGPCDPSNNRAIYQARVESVDQDNGQVRLRLSKCDGSPISANVSYWLVVGSDRFVSETRLCADATCTRASGTWPGGQRELVVTASGWPTRAAYEAAPVGDVKRLYVITGAADAPSARRWFQYESVALTRTSR